MTKDEFVVRWPDVRKRLISDLCRGGLDPDWAEDCAQHTAEILLGWYARLPAECLLSWSRTTATRLALRLSKQLRRVRVVPSMDFEQRQVDDNASAEALARCLADQLRAAYLQLPPALAKALSEDGGAGGLGLNAMAVRRHRARVRLAVAIERPARAR